MPHDQPTIRRMSEERNSVVKILSDRLRAWMQRLRVKRGHRKDKEMFTEKQETETLKAMIYGKHIAGAGLIFEPGTPPPWADRKL